jgi:acyl carrier protein
MMREKTVEKIIKDFIAKELMMDAGDIKRETNLVNDLNADSMDIVNIVTAVESKFKIAFPDDSKIKYDGYTLQFLIDGAMNGLRENKAKQSIRVRRKTSKVKAVEEAVEEA